MIDPEITKNPELDAQPVESPFDRIIIHYEEGRMIDALVPIELIDQSDVPVDMDHANDLAANMKKQMGADNPTGQDTPIGISHIPGENIFHITDGFHRTRGKEIDGQEYILCRIKTNATWEEIIDSRIVSATSHQPTKIPRLVAWINQSWGMTKWGTGKDGISAKTAFALAERDSSGIKLGLSSDEAKEIKELVKSKAEKWDLEIETVLTHLNTAEKIDPELLNSSRKRSGKKEIDAIAPGHLKILGQEIPGDREKQNAVADFAISNNLNGAKIRVVAREVAKYDEVGEALKKINDPAWKAENLTQKSAQKPKAATKPKRAKRTKTLSPDELPNIVVDEIDIASLALENTVLRGEYMPLPSGRVKRTYIELDDPGVNDLVKRYDWDDTKIKSTHLALLKDKKVGINHLAGKDGFFEDKAKLIVDIAVKRIMKDINDGALQYTGVPNIPALFARTMHDQTLREKNKIKEVPTLRGVTGVALDLGQYTEAMEELKDKHERRIITLSAVFNLNSFAISQVLKIEETEINQQIAKLTRDLG